MSALTQQLLANLDLRVLSIQRTAAGRWWNYQHVISPFARLWLILEGRAMVRHDGQNFPLRPGDLHLIPPFTEHDCFCPQRFDHYHLHFVAQTPAGIELLSLLDSEFQMPAPRQFLAVFQQLERLLPDRRLPCFDPSREEYRRHSLQVEKAAHEVTPMDWFEAGTLVRQLIAPFLRTAHSHEGPHARATRLFLAVQEFIHEHMHETILLGDLARVAKLHPTYFSDRFQNLVGVRPLEYLMRRRVERAQYLLLTEASSIKQVAVQVGIPDAAYFSRAFTRVCGTSPTAYRIAHT